MSDHLVAKLSPGGSHRRNRARFHPGIDYVYNPNFSWSGQLTATTLAQIASSADWRLPFTTVDELVIAMDVGAKTRKELLDEAAPYPTHESHLYTRRLLELLTGDDPAKHLWQHRPGYGYRLLRTAKRTLEAKPNWMFELPHL